jgi:hypothetical protein
MEKHTQLRTAAYFISIIAFVIALSMISTLIWGGKPEKQQTPEKLIVDNGMTVIQFGQVNGLPEKVLKEVFELKAKSNLEKQLTEYGTREEITSLVTERLALASEHASKNWIKILVKFILWFIFLSTIFILSRKRKMTPGLRNGLLFSSVLIFGVVLGADPAPMGTVKDTIHLYGTTHAIFTPRMVALTIFLSIVPLELTKGVP